MEVCPPNETAAPTVAKLSRIRMWLNDPPRGEGDPSLPGADPRSSPSTVGDVGAWRAMEASAPASGDIRADDVAAMGSFDQLFNSIPEV